MLAFFKMLKEPLWGLALVIFVTPLEPFFKNLAGFTIGRTLGTIAIMVWFIYLVSNQVASKKLNHSSLLRKQFFFLIPVLLSAMVWYLQPDGDRAVNSAFTFLLLGIMALMLENLVISKNDLILISLALSIAGVLACMPAIMYFLGIDVYTPLGADPPTEETEETLRATTLGGNPNSLGILARNGIFACVLLLTLVRKNVAKLSVWLMLLICFTGIVLSGSRTNFYGTLIMFLVLILLGFSQYVFKKSRIAFIIIGFALIGYAGFQLVPNPVQKRLFMGSGDKHIEERTANRVEFTQRQQLQAVGFFMEHPVMGVGLNRTYYESGYDLGAHDTISMLVGETGLLGTVGFLILFFWAIKKLLKARRKTHNVDGKIRISLMVGLLISMLIMGVLGGFIVPYDRTFWMTLALIYPVSNLAYQEDLALFTNKRYVKYMLR